MLSDFVGYFSEKQRSLVALSLYRVNMKFYVRMNCKPYNLLSRSLIKGGK